MKCKYATCVIPFAYTPRWGQIVIASLKAFKNARDFKIVVMNNSPERKDIQAILKTPLGEGVTVLAPPANQIWHAGSLEWYVPFLETPYMFALESDCTVNRDGWLDWYASFMKDDFVAMAGWYWMQGEGVDDERHYINSSATLYNSRILKLINQECLNNLDKMICYGVNNEKRLLHDSTAKRIEERAIGCFSEFRGFQQIYPVCPKPNKWWHEPGNWLYNRALCQWECVKVPGAIVWNEIPKAPEYRYNYYGESDETAYVRHYWAGTVSHNFDKHLVLVGWEADCIEWWLHREYDLWKEIVPEPIRKMSLEKGLVKDIDEEIKYALSRIHILKEGDLVRVYRHDAQSYIKKEVPEPIDLGTPGQIVSYNSFYGKWIIRLDREPIGEPYDPQYEDAGKWYTEATALFCVRR
uniref:Putative glycosyltransferase n=1 Tax=viral metagenome TaxID=1070528 RepID=A0A6M3KZQ0_9ZZZZ